MASSEPVHVPHAYELAQQLLARTSELLGEVAPEIVPHPDEHPTHGGAKIISATAARRRRSARTDGGRPLLDENWAERAACAGIDDALFVRSALQHEAKKICKTCPVRAECLLEALDNRIEWGVWGGLTESERRTLLKRRPNIAAEVSEHGLEQGA